MSKEVTWQDLARNGHHAPNTEEQYLRELAIWINVTRSLNNHIRKLTEKAL